MLSFVDVHVRDGALCCLVLTVGLGAAVPMLTPIQAAAQSICAVSANGTTGLSGGGATAAAGGFACGAGATAATSGATAVGQNSFAFGNQSAAFGQGALASGTQTTAVNSVSLERIRSGSGAA